MAEQSLMISKLKSVDVDKLILELAKEDNTPAQIGLILRDQHGIPKAKLVTKKITHLLKEKEASHITEKDIISKKIENLKKHFAAHKHDYAAYNAMTKKLWQHKKA
ncbi:hypothetical protein CMI47_20755 [Candidatus Pacearchaeota archaeon]|nr:hypothetical protein [Candidatus Pacearchaeota archaeon]|tara:strand:- start:759 stop:1076 length:318 start_codon:yes stop_codon:yes gene_type:complete